MPRSMWSGGGFAADMLEVVYSFPFYYACNKIT